MIESAVMQDEEHKKDRRRHHRSRGEERERHRFEPIAQQRLMPDANDVVKDMHKRPSVISQNWKKVLEAAKAEADHQGGAPATEEENEAVANAVHRLEQLASAPNSSGSSSSMLLQTSMGMSLVAARERGEQLTCRESLYLILNEPGSSRCAFWVGRVMQLLLTLSALTTTYAWARPPHSRSPDLSATRRRRADACGLPPPSRSPSAAPLPPRLRPHLHATHLKLHATQNKARLRPWPYGQHHAALVCAAETPAPRSHLAATRRSLLSTKRQGRPYGCSSRQRMCTFERAGLPLWGLPLRGLPLRDLPLLMCRGGGAHLIAVRWLHLRQLGFNAIFSVCAS